MAQDDDVIDIRRGRSLSGSEEKVTYDIGGYPPEVPLVGSYAITGKLQLKRQLPIGANVTINVAGPDGEIIAIAEGHVGSIPFVEHDDKELFWVERKHVITTD